MARVDPHILAHLEWLGFVRPTGLVVSAPALVRAGATLNRTDAEGQRRLSACLTDRDAVSPAIHDFRRMATEVLDWSFTPKYYAGTDERPIPPELEVTLPEFGETLRPDLAIAEPEPGEGGAPWQLLVCLTDPRRDLDDAFSPPGSTLDATAQGRMERLLRQTGVAAGVLFNGQVVRLISAPRGESSGWLDFRVGDMVQTAGRPMCAAMRLLLSQHRLLAAGQGKRLAALLRDSRRFQNEVSERLAEQVLHALYELVRGFQAAHDQSKAALLRDVLAEHPDQVYRALLTVLLRLVFLLYAEERDMLPEDETFLQHYSLGGLHQRLREDAALNPDTMDQRYGAWAQLLVLFRMVFDGAEWGGALLPRRHGVLFNPDRFPFLEGRPSVGARQVHEGLEPPLVHDGTVYRVLEKLLVLDGERISYRALDVEQIGSVYETMMGFRLETATGRSVAIKAGKKHGAPSTVDLDALLEVASGKRSKWLEERATRKLPAAVASAVKDAGTLEELHAALEKVVEMAATPDLVPQGAMVLQPSEERRKSGSHYTPRELTEPIVRTTLSPIFEHLRQEEGGAPTPAQILDLKVCDPAMGSGAFLVEACRQLGDALLEAWKVHGGMPELPSDEDEVVFARRMVAQRCVFGVDRNPVAVDLAKVSLWLATLAKDHPFTFLDHALRHGDSLVGLSRKQIEAFHWDPEAPRFQAGFEVMKVQEHVEKVTDLRGRIREAGEEVADWELRDLWDEADAELTKVRLFGDLVVAAFCEAKGAKEREVNRGRVATMVLDGRAESHRPWLNELRDRDPPLAPFHWEIEFPEVFDRENPGFDSLVGNPPFLGARDLGIVTPTGTLALMKDQLGVIAGKTDLVAYFFRRSWNLLRRRGTLGLISTNTIAQGDTHLSGLVQINREGGSIFSAIRRRRWPGRAAVVVSAVHIGRALDIRDSSLDGVPVERITTYLFPRGPDEPPLRLRQNLGKAGKGIIHSGEGFVFSKTGQGTWPVDLAHEMRQQSETLRSLIRPLWGAREFNNSSDFAPQRFVIDVGHLGLAELEASAPHLLEMLRERVYPERMKLKSQSGAKQARREWWRFTYRAQELRSRLAERPSYLGVGRVTHWLSVAELPSEHVPSEQLIAFLLSGSAAFAVLQARPHELWARFFGSSMKDDLRYTPSDCFETFPFPNDWTECLPIEAAGRGYYEYRAELMLRNDEGLTTTYNRFHDPDERSPEINRLRELHAAMDRAVLDAYGWTDIPTDCEFLLDYEEEDEEDSRRKKPWRYRWPDEVHDEVLARLLELNAERAREEQLAGGAIPTASVSAADRAEQDDDPDSTLDLFDA